MPRHPLIQRHLSRPFLVLRRRWPARVRLFAYAAALLPCGLVLLLALALWSRGSQGRVASETLQLPWSQPSETAWTTENAYPYLKFFEPTCIAFAADGSGRVFVLERRGTVQVFQDDPNVERCTQVLDVSAQVWRTAYEDDGAVAIALHPEFGQADSPNRGFFYLLYTAKLAGKRYDRLTRFTLVGNAAKDEFVLIDQFDEDLWHNGGGLAFGPDGFLYVGMGDEGTNGDGLENGQRLDRDLYCGILRIDVDQRGGDVSHAPPRKPATGRTQGYFIPSDNPFVGKPGTLEEFWAHGLRNPYRIAFDEESGRLWAADVGHLRREEINLIEAGANYGWSYREGALPFTESYLQGQPPGGSKDVAVDPVWEYPHRNGNNCVIGGMVYRGQKHADLQGKFIYADNGSGRVWALGYEEDQPPTNVELLSLPVSSKTGIASLQPDADGEPLLIILGEHGTTDGTIRRIVPAGKEAESSLPEMLSATGIFSDVATLTPAPGVIPYEVNASQSAGAARIRRWFAVPGDGTDPDATTDRIQFSPTDAWAFPVGTVFVQHFDLPVAVAGEPQWQPVETRVLVQHSGGGVYPLSYRWNDAGTDAVLVKEPQLQSVTVSDDHGTREQSWQLFDRQSCLACHNAGAGFVLGFKASQLNRDARSHAAAEPRNQLQQLSDLGYFHGPLNEESFASLTHLVSPGDGQASLDERARSYLDVNCAACHREGGARANFFAEFHRTEDLAELALKPLQGDFGLAGVRVVSPGDPFRSVLYYRMAKLGQGRMPFVGAHELDTEGLNLIREWIAQLPASDEDTPAQLQMRIVVQDDSIERLQIGDAGVLDDGLEDAVAALLADSRGAFALWQAVHDESIAEPLRTEIIGLASSHESPAVRDLFEWFIPSEQRTARLGASFDPLLVLQFQGDAASGRDLYHDNRRTSCLSCHAVESGKTSIGPNLSGIGKKYDRGELLLHITDPSKKIDASYATWLVETTRGRVLSGILVSQSEEEIVVRDEQGKEHCVKADRIDFMERRDRSMMPDQLLQALTPRQAADLLAYLRSL